MSKPKYRWWGYAKNIARSYPDLKKQHDEIQRQSVIANYSGMTGSNSGTNRTTENIAIRELPKQDQREFEAVEGALRVTENMPNGEYRMIFIDGIYFKRRFAVFRDAEPHCFVSERTLKRWNNEFLKLIGDFMGWMD